MGVDEVIILNRALNRLGWCGLVSDGSGQGKWQPFRNAVIKGDVLYGCETWSLTLRDERRLRVFKNRVLRRVFGPKRDEVTGKWGKLRNEELSDLYSLPNIVRVVKSRRMRGGGREERCAQGSGWET